MRKIIRVFRYIYKKLFPDWVEYLKKETAGCDTALDLGCGENSPIQHCNIPFSVGVDLFEPYLQESKKKNIHNQYINADITEIKFKPKSFTMVIATEVLEHLTKQEGYKLLMKAEEWVKKKVIITTPNKYLWQDGYDNNPFQRHKSGWDYTELKSLGFKVYGLHGWRILRGYKGGIKYKPIFFWERISDLTQKITYHFPNLAFQLFAVKEIHKE